MTLWNVGERWIQGGAAIACLLLASLYLASIGPYWNISPDSATYVGMAQAIAGGADGLSWGAQPPVTSLAFSVVLVLRPDGYLWLNAFTTLLILSSLAAAFVLVRRRAGTTQAVLAVLLSLACTRLYGASTQLLSEPVFLFSSVVALLLLEVATRHHESSGMAGSRQLQLADWGAGALIVITAMTRTIGIALPIAVLVMEGRAVLARRRKVNSVLVTSSLIALAAVVLWDLRTAGRSYLGGWFRMFVVDDPWEGAASLSDQSVQRITDRLRDNGSLLLSVGDLLVNQLRPGSDALALFARAGGTALFVLGVWRGVRRGASVLELYVLLFTTVATLHMVGGGGADLRFLIPVLPFLFAYSIDGFRQLTERVVRSVGSPARALWVLAACYVVVFVGHGARVALRGVREAHSSPFGAYPIKRPQNFDAQQIALWVRDNSRPEDRYASIQRDMYDVLTERRGLSLVPGRVTPAESFVRFLDTTRVRYVMVDRSAAGVRDSLLAIIRNFPDRFQLVLQLERASLYEVVRQE